MKKEKGKWGPIAACKAVRTTPESAEKMHGRWLVLPACAFAVVVGSVFPSWTIAAAYPGECHVIRYSCTHMTYFCTALEIESGGCSLWASTGIDVSDAGVISSTGYSKRGFPSVRKYQVCTVAFTYYENGWWDVSSRGIYRFHDDVVLPGEQYQPGESEIDYTHVCKAPSNPDSNPDPGKPDCPPVPLS